MKKAGARGRVAGPASAVAAGRQDWSCWAVAEGVWALERKAPPSWSEAWGAPAPAPPAALSRAALARASVPRRARTVSAVTSPAMRNTGRPAAAGPGVARSGVAASWAALPPPPAVGSGAPLDWVREGDTQAAQ